MTLLRTQVLNQQIILARQLAAEWPGGKMRTLLENHASQCEAESAADGDAEDTLSKTKPHTTEALEE